MAPENFPIVDHQTHWYPQPYVESLIGRSEYPRVERDADGGLVYLVDDGVTQPQMAALTADVEEHLAQADAAGIDMMVTGPATLAELLHLEAVEAAEMLDAIHVAYAEAQHEHPDRLAFLAALPMQDPAVALEVLDRAIGELGLRGVALLAVNEGRPLGGDETLPVFARIAELGVPLFLHPALRSDTVANTRTVREELGLAWMYQTAHAALELIDSGTLDAVPDLVVVHPHLGGVLPYVTGRIDGLPGSRAQRPVADYLKTRFYADTAAATPAALRLATDAYGVDRLLFASDHPFLPIARLRRYLEDNVDAETAARIYSNRVPGLLPPQEELR